MRVLLVSLLFLASSAHAEVSRVVKANICPPSITTTSQFAAITGEQNSKYLHTHGIYHIPLAGVHAFKAIKIVSTLGLPSPVPTPNANVTGSFYCQYDGTSAYYWITLHNLYSCTATGNSLACVQNTVP